MLHKLLIILSFTGFGMNKNYADSISDTLFAEADDIVKCEFQEENADIISCLDEMLNFYYLHHSSFVSDTSVLNVYGFKPDDVPFYSDSHYVQCLSKLHSPIDLTYNQNVKNYIEVYTMKKREQASRMLGLSQLYYPLFEKELDLNNMPLELKHLAVVESALNANAVSRAGAAGIWQFMYNTGKLYGLKVNSYVDERKDPYKATVAAVAFLKDLYAIYQDWLLAIAAYNCGPGNVNKAIRRSGGETDFWKIKEYLPKETRGYVPAFIAANYLMNYNIEHNIYPMKPEFNYLSLDTIIIKEDVTFQSISQHLNISLEEIKFLNPSIKKDEILISDESFVLNLPFEKAILFEQFKDSIYQSNKKSENNIDTIISYSVTTKNVFINNKTFAEEECLKLSYKIKAGDNLSHIAHFFDCKSQEIKEWNNIDNNVIREGDKLAIYVPKDKADKYIVVNNTISSKADIKRIDNNNVKNTNKELSDNSNYVYHTVKHGDTLWEIARLYSGVTVELLKKINKLSNTSKIIPGMLLIISEKG